MTRTAWPPWNAAGIPSVVAQLLIGRGICEPQAVKQFLDAKLSGLRDPELLPGAVEAAEILHDAIRAGKRIVVYGDYDADGMTATAILLSCLKLLGANVDYYVPNRIDEGYGLNHEALRSLAMQGAQVVVTVDCGIASVAEADTARELGLELIITDHHQPGDRLPDAAAIVHPRLAGPHYPFAGLCGAAVALKLAWALCQRASEAKASPSAMRDFLHASRRARRRRHRRRRRAADRRKPRPRAARPAIASATGRCRGSQALEQVTGLDKKPHLIGMEACATAHYWARALTQLGHQVRPMSAKDVKAYVKRNKNDAADAEAICEAVRRIRDRPTSFRAHRGKPRRIRRRTGLARLMLPVGPMQDRMSDCTPRHGSRRCLN